jgi:diaminopimelate decarboxylase
MGVKYNNKTKTLNYKKYNLLIKKFLSKNKTKIIFEPGRSIIADTAILLTKIIYIKKTKKKNFIILDAAMNDLIRPALYGAAHQIIPLKKNKRTINKIHDFVGPICESADKFLSVKKYQKLDENEILAICDVGAYGMVLSSNYNLRPKASEIMVNKSSFKVILKRQKLINII